jgi:hypothetical protein
VIPAIMLLAIIPGLLSIVLFVATLSSVPRGGTRRPAPLK